MKIDILSCSRIIFCVIFLLSINFPGVLQVLKLPLLLVVFLLLSMTRRMQRFKLSTTLVFFSLVIAFYGLCSIVYGGAVGNPGAFSMLNVLVVYPLLFMIIIAMFDEEKIKSIDQFLVFSASTLVISQVLYILSFYNVDGGVYYNFLAGLYKDELSINAVEENYFLFTHPAVSSFLFFIPYAFVSLIISEKISYFRLTIIVLMFILMLLTGRRAFYISFVIVILFAILVLMISNRPNYIVFKRLSIFVGLMVALVIPFMMLNILNVDILMEKLNSIFDFSSNESNLERKLQYDALMHGFFNNVFFGQGAGAVANYIRSHTQPWAYELSYIAMLFQLGLVGVLIYTSAVIYLFYGFISRIKFLSNEFLFFSTAVFSGFLSLIVANASNPYLLKFDYMWVIFLPVAIVNSMRKI